MRLVPMNRLLIQPTVQLKWLEQHGSIEFILEEGVLERFEKLWELLRQTKTPFNDFLISDDATEWSLHDDDSVFALLTGADYISNRYPSFTAECYDGRLFWSITQ